MQQVIVHVSQAWITPVTVHFTSEQRAASSVTGEAGAPVISPKPHTRQICFFALSFFFSINILLWNALLLSCLLKSSSFQAWGTDWKCTWILLISAMWYESTWKPCLPLHQVVSSFGGMSITETMSPTCTEQQTRRRSTLWRYKHLFSSY